MDSPTFGLITELEDVSNLPTPPQGPFSFGFPSSDVSDLTHETEESGQEDAATSSTWQDNSIQVSLFVRWHSESGKTKVSHLNLKPIGGLHCLQGVSKNLVSRAFPNETPEYLTSEDYYHFTPCEEFMALPPGVSRTQFRLVVQHDSWEYTVLERELGTHHDPHRNMLVTIIEFESTALMAGTLGMRMSMVSYPMVSVRKAFLEDIAQQLQCNPSFKGLL